VRAALPVSTVPPRKPTHGLLELIARRLIGNTIATATSVFVRLVTSYFLTAILIQNLGKDRYGVWMILLTFTLTGTLGLFTFGLPSALIKHVAQYHTQGKFQELNEVFSVTVLLFGAMALLGGAVVFVIGRFYLPSIFNLPPTEISTARFVTYIFAVMVLFELPGLAINGLLEGLQRYDALAALDVMRTLVSATAIVVLIRAGYGLVAIAGALFCSTLLYNIAALVLATQFIPSCRIVIPRDKKTLRGFLSFTLDIVVLHINGLVYSNMDKLIIGIVLSTSLLTEYDIANRIHSLVLTVMGLAPAVILSATSALHARNDHERQRELLIKGTKYTIAITLPVTVTLFVLAQDFIVHWISPQYAYVAIYARLFLAYLFVWPIVQLGWSMLIGVDKVRSMVWLKTISVALNLFLTIVLVSYIGVAGTMIGTVIANLLIFGLCLRLVLHTFHVTTKELLKAAVLPTYLPAAFLGLILYTVASHVPPKSLVEVVFYGVAAISLYFALFLAFSVDRSERLMWSRALLRRT